MKLETPSQKETAISLQDSESVANESLAGDVGCTEILKHAHEQWHEVFRSCMELVDIFESATSIVI